MRRCSTATRRPYTRGASSREVRDFLDYDATVIGDGGDIVTFAARVLNINEPGHWLDPGQFGCLGAGSGFAAAAQLARPGKQVCIIYGDGGFGLTGFDVESYVRHNLPIVSIVGNNGAWNQTTQGVVRRGMSGVGNVPVAGDRLRQDNGRTRRLRRARNRPGPDPPRPRARLRLRQSRAPRRGNRPRSGLRRHGRPLPPVETVLG